MLRYFGVVDVRVLNGGMPKWKSEGREVATEFSDFGGKGSFDFFIPEAKHAVTDIKEVHRAAYYLFNQATDMQVLDARPAPRFNGEVPEPRKGLRSGHITGSINMPFPDLVSAGCLKSDKDLSKIFLEKNIDTTVHTINSCGSGVTACMIDLALRVVGGEHSHIYDGSWSEYVSSFYVDLLFECRVVLMSLISRTGIGTAGTNRVSKKEGVTLSIVP